MKQGFTDIHTHILPSVDDGAQSVEDALELLRLEKQKGVVLFSLRSQRKIHTQLVVQATMEVEGVRKADLL